jgi:hypothetical protein
MKIKGLKRKAIIELLEGLATPEELPFVVDALIARGVEDTAHLCLADWGKILDDARINFLNINSVQPPPT